MNSLFFVNQPLSKSSGISNKIIEQNKCLAKFNKNHSFSHLEKCDDRYYHIVNGQKIQKLSSNSIARKLQIEYRFKYVYNLIKENDIDLLYIRYIHQCNLSFLFFLKRANDLGCKVILEVPTFPYDDERSISFFNGLRNFANSLFIVQERFTRKFLYKYVDKVVTFSNDKYIFNIPTVRISNAVSRSLSYKKTNKNLDFNFVGVASLESWHGYDRLIRSIATYYLQSTKENKVYFHIVGDGQCFDDYTALVKQLNLEKYVKFYGRLDGELLTNVILQSTVGVDSLGRHRSKLEYNNSLKSKEYLMRGLPLIKSHKDYSIDSQYYFQIDASEDEFDIGQIIDWYENSNFDTFTIRSYAESYFTWDKQFDKVFEQLEK
ncbi:hypothetical protein E2K93_01540 [Thalassotalea sp. HSM 43]|uniref:glycosyltransferase n=1 Tax=Thalassotalea sp. HSM 43 TaxID=2552945 RepID=UPI001081CCA2|nr:glycosyltransferase [Thalassotalea sp. HSM 43]QBY03130.1 hypothetical protein E2K93_01540 [Thalassotalea sp. HSM 43]